MTHAATVLETVCADAWPPVVERRLGQWRLRAAGGYTGRANSAFVSGDPGVPLREALAEVVAFSDGHGVRPYLQVVVGDPVERELAGLGWAVNRAHAKGEETAVLAGPALPEPGEVAEVPQPGWFEVVLGGAPTDAQRHVLTTGPRVGFAVARHGDEVVGAARGCVVGDYLHVGAVEVLEAHRRKGHARAMLRALDHWAGVPYRVLQVALRNTGAMALYASDGMVDSHHYRYWAEVS